MKTRTWKLFVLLIVFLLSCLQAQAQYREEVGALEELYEGRAKSALSSILNPQEYSVIVSVDIDRDQTRLKALEEEVEKSMLPGMPGMDSFSGSLPLQNQLHDLKSKVDIHVVMSDKLSKDKEETVKTLLKMKLHLDESNGDTLVVSRSRLAASDEQYFPALPELSWKMWALVLIVSLLSLAGLVYAFQRKKESATDFNQNLTKEAIEPVEKPSEAVAEADEEKSAAGVPGRQVLNILEDLDPTEELFEKKKSILSIATQYPEATAKSLTEYFVKHEQDVLLVCEALGWDISKKIFSGFSTRMWGRIGFLLMSRKEKPSLSQVAAALDNCHRVVLATFLELNEEDSHNPFMFIEKLTETDRKNLLSGESASEIAALCLYLDSNVMGSVIEQLPDQLQEAVTLHIARLKSVPHEVVQATAEKLAKKLKTIQAHKVHEMNGTQMAANLIRTMPAEKELTLLEKMHAESPQDAELVRQTILFYIDVPSIPGDVISEACGLIDMKVLANAMSSGHEAVAQYILKSLPSKKSMMIQKDISFLSAKISDKQIGLAQRELVMTIQAVLKSRDIDLKSLVVFEKQPVGIASEAA